jgi:cytochrome c556
MPTPGTRFHSCNRVVTLFVFMLAGPALIAGAQSAPRPEAFIKWRQSAYQVVGWNSGRIKSALAGKHDSREVAAAANALAAVAGSGLVALFPAGTERGKGWRETTARESVWTEAARFRALNDEFARETGELARLAAGADTSAVQAQFQKVAKTCKSCHDGFRQVD